MFHEILFYDFSSVYDSSEELIVYCVKRLHDAPQYGFLHELYLKLWNGYEGLQHNNLQNFYLAN